MERRVFITTTNTVNLRPLAWQGVRAVACYEQLARILQSRLTAAHLALLAEPIPDSSGENVDWYAHLPEMNSITAVQSATRYLQSGPGTAKRARQ